MSKRQQLTSKNRLKTLRDPSTSEASARGSLACGVGPHKRGAAGPVEAVGAGDVAGQFARGAAGQGAGWKVSRNDVHRLNSRTWK
jgi:hypothetical protein